MNPSIPKKKNYYCDAGMDGMKTIITLEGHKMEAASKVKESITQTHRSRDI